MLRLRIGLICAALLFTGCDHHKPAAPAQAQAGTAESDSALTGEPSAQPADADGHAYPRATLVSLPPSETTPVVKTENADQPMDASEVAASAPQERAPSEPSTPAEKSTPEQSSSAPTDSSSSAPSTPTASARSSSSPPSDSDMTRLAMTPTSPTVATDLPPAPDTDEAHEQVAVLDTTLGRIVIEFDDIAAPKTCENFRKLVTDGFYNHTVFHRIIPNFIIQGGDPNSKGDDRGSYGQGGPGYTLPAEIKLPHDRGSVAMARLPDSVNPQRESNGSQFYICVVDCPSLDNAYTVFGHIIKGLDVVNRIANQPRDSRDNPIKRIEMEVTLEPKAQALSEPSH